MRLALSSDHAGFELKRDLAASLGQKGHMVLDLGTHSLAPVDYPDAAESVAQALRNGDADRGIIVCGSGAGVSIAANKFPGIRAAVCHDTYTAHQAVEHDDMNVLCIGARIIGSALACEIVDLGTNSSAPVDYPDSAETVATCLAARDADRGIIVCGSGAGVSIAANKFPGIRASVCHDTYTAHQAVEHDDMNVLCIGAMVIGSALAQEIAEAFLRATFSGEDRHQRRLNKVLAIESRFAGAHR